MMLETAIELDVFFFYGVLLNQLDVRKWSEGPYGKRIYIVQDD